jgi:outer membrane protein assembly factor BamB
MGGLDRRSQRRRFIAPAVLLAAGLSGCSDSLPSLPKISDLNPFAEKQQPLPGTRIPVMQAQDKIGGAELAAADKPIVLPPPRANDGWTQPAPSSRPGVRTPAPVRAPRAV